mmetsp:Transcript_44782/g.74739  ORF Transcript_44782/g.74739 Transcript_44782/m.74739 type:complete len:191 (-) Transcript_44782:105-677(-)
MKVQRGRNKDGSLKEKRKMEIYKCRLREEAESLDKFKNMDHVVQIVEHFAVSFKDDASGIQRYVIVMRKMEPLTKYLRYQLPCCDDDLFVDVTRKIVGQIRKGLQTIHSKKMIHRDIKPANVLLTLNGETNTPVSVVIADFGWLSIDNRFPFPTLTHISIYVNVFIRIYIYIYIYIYCVDVFASPISPTF